MKVFETFESSGQNLSNSLSILKQQVYSSPNLVSLVSFMKDTSSVHFSSSNIYFAQKEPIQVTIFETFTCSGQYLSNSLYMSICKRQVNSSPNFVPLFSFMKDNSSVLF